MLELVFLTALWSQINGDFINVSNKQMDEGYQWEYVGKQEASGAPSVSMQPGNGKEFIFFRLEE